MTPLTDSNFLLYAAKNYDNPSCHDTVEFYADIKRFKYIKKLLNHYLTNDVLKDRLILNHFIILFNVFGHTHATRMLFFKLPEYHSQLKSILSYMKIMPDIIESVFEEDITILSSRLKMDDNMYLTLVEREKLTNE